MIMNFQDCCSWKECWKIINLKYTIGLALLHLHSKFTTLCYYSTRIIECIAINSEKNERVAKMRKTYFKDLIFSLVMSQTKKDLKIFKSASTFT